METSIIKGGLSVDDRGMVTFVNDFNLHECNIKRFYMVENHEKGFIRAWHGHMNEEKYVHVVQGTIKIGIVDLTTMEIEKTFCLSSLKPEILHIPKNKANGFITLQENTKVIFYSNCTLEESLNDDIRYSYDRWNIWDKIYR